MSKQRQVQVTSTLVDTVQVSFDQHDAAESADNGTGLYFGSAVREPWDYMPMPPFAVDDDGYLTDDSMSQSDRHAGRMLAYGPVLKAHYRGHGGFVGVDLSMPYVKGSPGKVLVPDLFVALQAEERYGRSSYKLWEEPVPDFVLEDLSPNNWRRDVVDKRVLYQRLGVREYWMFDETGTRLRDESGSPLGDLLIGLSLRNSEYKRVRANAAGRLPSEVLKLELFARDDLVRFHDPATGECLPTYEESRAQAKVEAQRAERERAKAVAALARVAALEAELRSKHGLD